jgi:hypothetical protein
MRMRTAPFQPTCTTRRLTHDHDAQPLSKPRTGHPVRARHAERHGLFQLALHRPTEARRRRRPSMRPTSCDEGEPARFERRVMVVRERPAPRGRPEQPRGRVLSYQSRYRDAGTGHLVSSPSLIEASGGGSGRRAQLGCARHQRRAHCERPRVHHATGRHRTSRWPSCSGPGLLARQPHIVVPVAPQDCRAVGSVPLYSGGP